MRFMSPAFVRNALRGHAAVGLLAGVLLYLLCLSGTLLVLHSEWERWEQPGVSEMTAASPAAVQRAVGEVIAAERGKPPTTHLFVQLPTAASPRLILTTDSRGVFADTNGAIEKVESHGWSEFLVNLHYYLHLPSTLGLALVGVLGVMMAALVAGGVLAHPRIFRDAFRLRGRAGGQVGLADWHNRLGVWTLPFGLAVSITGALIGLASVIAFAMAAAWYDGKVEGVFAPLFGGEPKVHAATVTPNVSGALDDFRGRFPNVVPTFLILHDPGSTKQYVQIMAEHPRRLIFGEYYRYDEQGRYQGLSHLSDGAMGQQAAASTYRLHFGNFAGLPMKLAYMLFGLATVVVTATGTSLWLGKRRQRGRASPRLEAMWSATVWGTPALFALAALTRLVAGGEAPLGAIFWIGLALLLPVSAAVANAGRVATLLRTATSGLLLAVVSVHIWIGGGWALGPLMMDASLVVAAALLALPWLRRPRTAGSASSDHHRGSLAHPAR